MNVKELAEKITDMTITARCTGDDDYHKLVSKIESLLSEAMEVAKTDLIDELVLCLREDETAIKIRNEAYARAAEVARKMDRYGHCDCRAAVIVAAIERLRENKP